MNLVMSPYTAGSSVPASYAVTWPEKVMTLLARLAASSDVGFAIDEPADRAVAGEGELVWRLDENHTLEHGTRREGGVGARQDADVLDLVAHRGAVVGRDVRQEHGGVDHRHLRQLRRRRLEVGSVHGAGQGLWMCFARSTGSDVPPIMQPAAILVVAAGFLM